jgi:hypothetical protein
VSESTPDCKQVHINSKSRRYGSAPAHSHRLEGTGAPSSRKNTFPLFLPHFARISVEQFIATQKKNVKTLCGNGAPSSFPGATRTGTFFQ